MSFYLQFLDLYRRMLVNMLRNLDRKGRLRLVALLLLGVGFIAFDFGIFYKLISYIMQREELGPLRIVLLTRLLSLVFIIFMVMLIYSNIITAIGSMFLGYDIEYLLARPVSHRAIFIQKSLEASMSSSWMLIAFGIPIFAAYGLVLKAPWYYHLLLLVPTIAVIVICGAVGTSLAVVLMRYFPPRRTQQLLAVLGLFLAVIIVVLFVFLRPEDIVNPVGMEVLASYLERMRVPTNPYYPSTWATESLMGIIDGSATAFTMNTAYLLLFAGLCLFAYLEIGGRLYYKSYSRSASGGIGTRRRRSIYVPVVSAGLRRWLHPSTRQLLAKDGLYFVREPGQWSQIFILLALVIITVYNFYKLPFKLLMYPYTMSFAALGLTGFILSAVATRFAYPAVSLEGGAFWLLKSSPLRFRRYFMVKFIIISALMVIFGEMIILFSNLALEVEAKMIFASCGAIFFMSLAITGLALGLGARYPVFHLRDPAAIVTGPGGLIYMIIVVIYILGMVGLMALPGIIRFFPHFYRYRRHWGDWDFVVIYGLAVLISLFLAIYPLKKGIKDLERIEI